MTSWLASARTMSSIVKLTSRWLDRVSWTSVSPAGCWMVYSVFAALSLTENVPGYGTCSVSPTLKVATSLSVRMRWAATMLARRNGIADCAQISGMKYCAWVTSIVLANEGPSPRVGDVQQVPQLAHRHPWVRPSGR